ncbi:aminoglycoside phosphotransferase family protein [Methylorubrum suomiense]
MAGAARPARQRDPVRGSFAEGRIRRGRPPRAHRRHGGHARAPRPRPRGARPHRPHRLGRGRPGADAGRRVLARLRAAGEARRRDRGADDRPAPPRRPAGQGREALQRDRQARREHPRLRRDGPGPVWARHLGPRILGENLKAGLLILEDLGAEPVVENGAPRPERYAEAVRLLAKLHATDLPDRVPVAEGIEHVLPPYDLEALLFEAELMPEWYAPAIRSTQLPAEARRDFLSLWSDALRDLLTERPTWTLRDYHSPNLIWLPAREGLERVGVIDFQDAVMGHPAYDVASLLQDARVDCSADFELRLLGLYIRERRARDPGFDLQAFARSYAVLAAQRATKILGIFARLDKRDGKPGYLAHLPRIEGYLARNLAHPALGALRAWHETRLPSLVIPAAS